VQKTGGDAEHCAFQLLRAHLAKSVAERESGPGRSPEASTATSQER
jgi:hypothetical protein